MNIKNVLIAEEIKKRGARRVADIGYAQWPNRELAETGAEIYGVDIVAEPAPYADTFIADLNTEPLPFKDGELDAVTMGCTLAHVAKPLKLLADINRVLKTGGVLVLTSPNPNYYWENILNIFYHSFKKRVSKSKHTEHFYDFSRYTMRTVLERAGFRVVREAGVGFQLVKTPFRFNVTKFPGVGFEIMYVAEKRGAPEAYVALEDAKGEVTNMKSDIFS